MRKLILDIAQSIYDDKCKIYRGHSVYDTSSVYENCECTHGWSISLKYKTFLSLPEIQVRVGGDVVKLTKDEKGFIKKWYDFAVLRHDISKDLSDHLKMIKGLNVPNSK